MKLREKAIRGIALLLGIFIILVGVRILLNGEVLAAGMVGIGTIFLFYALTGKHKQQVDPKAVD